MTGYELAERLARVLGMEELSYGDANQIVNASERIANSSDTNAVPVVSYLIGMADASPSSYCQYVDMVATQAEDAERADYEDRWTVLQYAEEAAHLLGRAELTGSDCEQLVDYLQEALMHSEPLVTSLVPYLAGRAHLSPSEMGQRVSEAVRQP